MDLKYVHIYNSESFMHTIVLFDDSMQHCELDHLTIRSAGFCEIDFDRKIVRCYGKSLSTNKCSKPKEDTYHATKLVFGQEAATNYLNDLERINKCNTP
jgi:hypothetical protein